MKEYAVKVTDATEDAIYDQARYIATEKHEPLNAMRWLESTFDAIHMLKTFPKRCAVAEENNEVNYEVRQLPIAQRNGFSQPELLMAPPGGKPAPKDASLPFGC